MADQRSRVVTWRVGSARAGLLHRYKHEISYGFTYDPQYDSFFAAPDGKRAVRSMSARWSLPADSEPEPGIDAPGRPGIPPTWTSSSKDAVGSSLGPSRLWFTLGYGIINEVYWPRIDLPQIRDLGSLLPTEGDSGLRSSGAATTASARLLREYLHYLVQRYGLARAMTDCETAQCRQNGKRLQASTFTKRPSPGGLNMDSLPGMPTMRTITCTRSPSRTRRVSNAVDGIVLLIEPPLSRRPWC